LGTALGTLWAGGLRVDWSRLYPGGGTRVRWPSYPWQRAELWSETLASRSDRLVSELHPLLHQPAPAPGTAWDTEVGFQFFPYLRDHRVAGAVVYPGAAYVIAALAAGPLAKLAPAVEGLTLHRALLLDRDVTVRLSLDARDGHLAVH